MPFCSLQTADTLATIALQSITSLLEIYYFFTSLVGSCFDQLDTMFGVREQKSTRPKLLKGAQTLAGPTTVSAKSSA
jgi:hypothetical protein